MNPLKKGKGTKKGNGENEEKKSNNRKKWGYLTHEILPWRSAFDDKPFYKVSLSTVQIKLDRVGQAHKYTKYYLT